MKEKMDGIGADIFLNATGLRNLTDEEVESKDLDDEIDEIDEAEDADPQDEFEEDGVQAEPVIDEIPNGVDGVDEHAEQVIVAAQAEAAKIVEEMTTPAKAPAPKKGGGNMATYPIEFYDNVRSMAYEAAHGEVRDEFREFILNVIKSDDETRAMVAGYIQAYEEDQKVPEYVVAYKAQGILGNKVFEDREAAEKAAKDFLSLGHEFGELFVADLFYKNKDGKRGRRIPDKSPDRKKALKDATDRLDDASKDPATQG